MSTPDTQTTNGDPIDDLRQRVEAKRRDVGRYLREARRRRRLLVQTTIIAGAIATALTAAPALGGQSLADWLTVTFALAAPSWQILCGIAAVCSLAATVATQLHKSNNYDERVARAQSAMAVLEELDVGLSGHDLDLDDATARYVECVKDTSFIAATGDT